MREALHYDETTRIISDENGLMVAQGVLPEDAAWILEAAINHGEAAATLTLTAVDPADFADAMRVVGLRVVPASDQAVPAPGSLAELLAEMLEYQREQFDGDPDVDLNVSGADLVDAFTGWRDRLKMILADHQPVTSFGVVRAMVKAMNKMALETEAHFTPDELEGDWPGMDVGHDLLGKAASLGEAYLRSAAIAQREDTTPEAVTLYALVDAINFSEAAREALKGDETFLQAQAMTDSEAAPTAG